MGGGKVNYLENGDGTGGEPAKKMGNVESSNTGTLNLISDQLAEEAEAVQSEIDSMNAAISQGMAQMISTFAEGFGQMLTGDIGLDSFFNMVLGQFGGFVKQMGEMLIAYGIAMKSFKEAFKSPLAAIAAGAALVVIGSAISSLASSGPGGSSEAPATSATYGSYASANTGSAVPSTAMSMPTSSGDNQMVLQVEMATELRSDHIALMAKKGANKINRRG